MEPGGIEPPPKPPSRHEDSRSDDTRATRRATRPDRGLLEIVHAWPNLPHHERSAILTIVRASLSLRSTECDRHAPDRPRIADERSAARQGIKSSFDGDAGADRGTPPASQIASTGGLAARDADREGGAA